MTGGVARFLSLNLWGENGPWEARMALLAARLEALAPDVIGLQEVREVAGRVPNQAAALAAPRGFHHAFAPTSGWGGGHEGLAIVSRFPIGAQQFRPLPFSTETEGRGILSARLDGEAGGIWVHTTHLSYREHEGLWREAQVQFVDQVLTEHDNGNPRVVMGDFNTVPESDEIRFLTGQHTLGGKRVAYQDAWTAVNQDRPGPTWCRANDYTERMHWLRRDRRIDYVFVTPVRRDRRATVRAAAVVLDAPEIGPDGARLFASDHFGVTADVQLLQPSDDPR
ncbi:MAG TPA: endonuclease/exonuclease/phosphatase family protein [Polyangia bacterium]|nr:endonuclease/exonuclease/phosphatase family protein [Polyangia bacterium]